MKTLDEKAAEYAASVVSCNKEAKECEGLIQTAYVLGAMEGELLGEETGTFGQALESLKRGYNVRRKAWVRNGDMFIVKQIDSDISPEIVHKMQSLPDAAKEKIGKHADGSIHYRDQCLVVYPDAEYGCMATNYVPDWQDMFSNDWMIVE